MFYQKIYFIILCIHLGVFSGMMFTCTGSSEFDSQLPEHYQSEGLITSNTYQINVEVIADSREEAMRLGKSKAKSKIYNMMTKEPTLNSRIGFYGRKSIKDLIDKKGEIVYIAENSEQSWRLVFQVYKKGLWDYLRKLY